VIYRDTKFLAIPIPMIRRLRFSTPVSTWSFHGGDMDNEGFYTDEHCIYPYIPGKTPVRADVVTECTVSAGPYTVDSQTYVSVCPQMIKIFLFWVNIHGHTVTDHVLSGINLCTIRIHPCLSIENTRTQMVPVFTRSLRWLSTRYLPVYTRNQHG
jgi:hypothetical protein